MVYNPIFIPFNPNILSYCFSKKKEYIYNIIYYIEYAQPHLTYSNIHLKIQLNRKFIEMLLGGVGYIIFKESY